MKGFFTNPFSWYENSILSQNHSQNALLFFLKCFLEMNGTAVTQGTSINTCPAFIQRETAFPMVAGPEKLHLHLFASVSTGLKRT